MLFAALLCGETAWANDGVYFTSGSFLIPVKETDISAKKEILTITICKDGYAIVDVDYTFCNNTDAAKKVTMAFEANAPYNAGAKLNRNGKHPFISKFTAEMNDKQLEYRNALVALKLVNDKWESDHQPLDIKQWKGYGEVSDDLLPFDDAIYNVALDSASSFAYAYYFDANFLPGENKVHHTYRYKMSFNVSCKFEINYWLTPVTRWANGQVDDFTLRIKTDGRMEDVMFEESLFHGNEFKVCGVPSTIYHLKDEWHGDCIFTTVSDESVLEWHAENFSPKENLCIESGDALDSPRLRMWATEAKVVVTNDGNVYRYLSQTEDGYFVSAQDYGIIPKSEAKIEEYDAEHGQGFLYLNDDTKAANVRASASTKSKVVHVIKSAEGELPEAYPCLGLVRQHKPNGDIEDWFKIKVGNGSGYVRRDLVMWDAINPF